MIPDLELSDPHPDPATGADVAGICRLTWAAQPDCIPLGAEEVRAGLDRFEVVRDARGDVVATAALVPLDGARAELRGVAVAAAHRGRHLGSLLVRHALAQADAEGRTVLCVTRKPGFFRRHGFIELPATELPAKRNLPRPKPGAPPLPPRVAMAAVEAVDDLHLRRAG